MKNPSKIHYSFSGKLWKHGDQGGWYFVSLPKEISKEIRDHLQWQEEGWGRMKATARTAEIEWDTAIWYDKHRKTYLLPIKVQIRKQAELTIDQVISIRLFI